MSIPDVSVIIPVFDKASHIRECVDSVLAQSLSTIEVICIDDNSTDGSAEILEHYAGRDPRVRFFRNLSNLGAGATRNIGIELARGNYVQFTDADDVLPPGAIDALHQRIALDQVEMVRGMVATFFSDRPEQLSVVNPLEERHSFVPLDCRDMWFPWWHTSYLILRSFLVRRKIRYPSLRAGEDPVFLATSLVHAQRISAISQVTYHYRIQPFEQKKRTSFSHFQHYLQHAAMVRDIFLGYKQECWTEGYGPYIREDLKNYLKVCGTTAEEQESGLAAIQNL